jgi:molecular chaperone HtpG
VVDSEDLPLNISRETLQHNPLLEKIRESLVKKILAELKKKADKDAESYQKFWDNFGAVLKEGLCETIAPKEKILEVCQFYSTHMEESSNPSKGEARSGGGSAAMGGQAPHSKTTLDKYIDTMKPEQEAIYYLIGDRLETLRHHPQIEGFRKQGIEVLLFTDHVDDFWVNVVHEYKGKALKSVTKASADLDKHASDKSEETAEKVTSLIPLLREIYGEAVRDVRTTHKLDESPVCLAVGEGDMDIRMERFLRENKQLPGGAYAKILEINSSHPVIQAMERKAASGKSTELEDMAWLLLDQARIIEGEEISDPAAFSRRLTQFLTRGLMAA